MLSLKTLAIAGATTVSLVTVQAQATFAGDLPPPPIAQPVHASPVFGNDSGFYLRGDIGVGVNNVGKHSTQISVGANAPGVVGYNDDLSASGFIGVGAGYAVNNWLRFDGTLEYRGGGKLSSVDYYNSPQAGGGFLTGKDFYSANVSSIVGLANAYVDLGTWYCITPYIGAGVGFANNRISGFTDQGYSYPTNGAGVILGPGSPSGAYYKPGSSTNFAWALMAGLGYDVTSNLKLDIGYRYLNMGKVSTGSSVNQFGPPNYTYTQKSLSSHDFRLGMRWVFADKGSAPPPPSYSAPLVRKY